MKDKQTIAQFLNVKDFPFEIKDKKGHLIYREDSSGYWINRQYDIKGNEIYREDSDRYWFKIERDDNGAVIYHEDSNGYIIDKRPKLMIELTLEDIAKLKGVDVSQIRIKE
jgi:hypothetical protein